MYLWSPTTGLSNPTIANPTASPATTTTYTVTVTNITGCTATDQITVEVSGTISVSAGQDQSVFIDCDNNITGAQLSASGGLFYAWTPTIGLSSPSSPSPLATPTTSTTYSVVITDENGCTGTDEVFVTVVISCLLYTSPSPRDATLSRMPSSA